MRDDKSDEAGADGRLPYAPPIIESGDAFEKVQLASGCDSGLFDGCEIPCDG